MAREEPVIDDVDRDPRYAPTRVLCRGSDGFRERDVVKSSAYPPGQHPKGCPLVADCVAVELRTADGVCWYGFEKAWINSELRMVVQGFSARDEVRAKWPKCVTAPPRTGRRGPRPRLPRGTSAGSRSASS
jgi:hypothetical protein